MLEEIEGHDVTLVPEYADGVIVGVLPDGAGHLVQLPGTGPATYATRSMGQVVGWRAVCSCGGWRSDPWRRTTQGVDDLVGRVVRATDADEVAGVPGRPEVLAAAAAVWTTDHLAALRATAAVEAAQRRVETALLALDDAVAEARKRGVTWENIGRAAGLTRQSAHARWARRATGGRHRSAG